MIRKYPNKRNAENLKLYHKATVVSDECTAPDWIKVPTFAAHLPNKISSDTKALF